MSDDSSVVPPRRRTTVLVITGVSGAGRSTALRALEDIGFFCIDNLPTVMAPEAVALCEKSGIARVALGMDVRVRVFLGELEEALSALEASSERDVGLLFLDASDEAILRRFSETRRPHALAAADGTRDAAMAVLDGVKIERERLAPLRARATRVIDTTRLSVHELRRLVLEHFGPSGGTERMTVRIVSFGFKYGTPVDADLVLDVRFLTNPFFIPDLKDLPGTDRRVRDFVLGLPDTAEFLEHTVKLLAYVLPKYEREGKSYLTIGIGCTGGRHRSVVLSEALKARLSVQAQVVHRDVLRANEPTEVRPKAPSLTGESTHTELAAGLSPLPQPVSEHLRVRR